MARLKERAHKRFHCFSVPDAVSQNMYPQILSVIECRYLNPGYHCETRIFRYLIPVGKRIVVCDCEDIQSLLPSSLKNLRDRITSVRNQGAIFRRKMSGL